MKSEKAIIISSALKAKENRLNHLPIMIILSLAFSISIITAIVFFILTSILLFSLFLISSIGLFLFMIIIFDDFTAIQMKIYDDGLALPFRSLRKIVQGEDNFIPLDKIESIVIKRDSEGEKGIRIKIQGKFRVYFIRESLVGLDFIRGLVKIKLEYNQWEKIEIHV